MYMSISSSQCFSKLAKVAQWKEICGSLSSGLKSAMNVPYTVSFKSHCPTLPTVPFCPPFPYALTCCLVSGLLYMHSAPGWIMYARFFPTPTFCYIWTFKQSVPQTILNKSPCCWGWHDVYDYNFHKFSRLRVGLICSEVAFHVTCCFLIFQSLARNAPGGLQLFEKETDLLLMSGVWRGRATEYDRQNQSKRDRAVT